MYNMADFDPRLLTGVSLVAGLIVMGALAVVWWDNWTYVRRSEDVLTADQVKWLREQAGARRKEWKKHDKAKH